MSYHDHGKYIVFYNYLDSNNHDSTRTEEFASLAEAEQVVVDFLGNPFRDSFYSGKLYGCWLYEMKPVDTSYLSTQIEEKTEENKAVREREDAKRAQRAKEQELAALRKLQEKYGVSAEPTQRKERSHNDK